MENTNIKEDTNNLVLVELGYHFSRDKLPYTFLESNFNRISENAW